MTTKKKPATQKMFVEEEEANATQKAAEKPSEPVKEQTLTPGANYVTLPSEGYLGYPETVEYRDILVKDEETLAMATPETYAKTLNSVLKGILNDCPFYEKLCIHDRDYMLVWLWANNYQSVKKVDVTCSNEECGHEEVHEVDLTELDVADINPKIPVPFEIPISGDKKISVMLNTAEDELQVESFMAKQANKEAYSFAHLMMVASIKFDVAIPFDKKVAWVGENLKSKDMAYVKKFHQYFKFGVSDTVEHKCSACGEVTKGSLPFSASDVLWPTVDVDIEDLL